jgi:hypothetical protein
MLVEEEIRLTHDEIRQLDNCLTDLGLTAVEAMDSLGKSQVIKLYQSLDEQGRREASNFLAFLEWKKKKGY